MKVSAETRNGAKVCLPWSALAHQWT